MPPQSSSGSTAADALATEGELPQVRVLPLHGRLNGPVELSKRHRKGRRDLPPDRRIAVDEIDAQRCYHLALRLALGAHPANLAARRCHFQGIVPRGG